MLHVLHMLFALWRRALRAAALLALTREHAAERLVVHVLALRGR